MNLDDLRLYAFENNLPLEVNIELTQKCNFQCLHCYCPEDKKTLTTEQAKSIILECHKAGVLFVNFTGGEVTLRKDFYDIYKFTRKLGFLVSVQTNLSNLSEKLKHTLAMYKPKKISVTLYGTSDEEYQYFTGVKKGYSQVITNLDFLCKEKIEFSLKAVLTKATYGSATNKNFEKIAAKYSKAISWDPIIFGAKDGNLSTIENRLTPREIVNFDRTDAEGVSFWNDKVKNITGQNEIKCGGGISSFSIDSTGKASICSLYVSEKYDLHGLSFQEVWEELKKSNARMQTHYKNSPCSSCDKKSICRWCAAYAVLEHGNPEQPVAFMCSVADERVNRTLNDSENINIICKTV